MRRHSGTDGDGGDGDDDSEGVGGSRGDLGGGGYVQGGSGVGLFDGGGGNGVSDNGGEGSCDESKWEEIQRLVKEEGTWLMEFSFIDDFNVAAWVRSAALLFNHLTSHAADV